MKKRLYLAPLEGITTYVYRKTCEHHFPGAAKYFSPFIVPNKSKGMGPKEFRDVDPSNNPGVCLIPQILTNFSEDFLHCATVLQDLGYSEINLNLGCPSGTVTAKGRGAGFLAYPDRLHAFLEEIFAGATASDLRISIKTRLGLDDPEEFPDLLDIYNEYPLEELIIHPRVRTDFYKNHPRMEQYAYASKYSKCSLCYNGNLHTFRDYQDLLKSYPDTSAVMIGRGAIANPGIFQTFVTETPVTKQAFYDFLQDLYEAYKEKESGQRNVLFRMKELWFYMAPLFEHGEKAAKKIKKSANLADYDAAVAAMFENHWNSDGSML